MLVQLVLRVGKTFGVKHTSGFLAIAVCLLLGVLMAFMLLIFALLGLRPVLVLLAGLLLWMGRWLILHGQRTLGFGPKWWCAGSGDPPPLFATDEARRAAGALRVVCLSDTHNKHGFLQVPDGDVLIHAGDFSYSGTDAEIGAFGRWLAFLPHRHKVVIAGNHDMSMDDDFCRSHWAAQGKATSGPQRGGDSERAKRLLVEPCRTAGSSLFYLEHETADVAGLRIFGSPFSTGIPNRPRMGFQTPSPTSHNRSKNNNEEGGKKNTSPNEDNTTTTGVWGRIVPDDVDIVVTHGPPKGVRDQVLVGTLFGGGHVGDAQLMRRVEEVRPKFHVFGHIHEGFGVEKRTWPSTATTTTATTTTTTTTTFVNAANLDFLYKPRRSAVVVFDVVVPPGR